MKNKKKRIKNAIPLILVLSLIIPNFSGIEFQEVKAAKRLQGIEKIVTTLGSEKFTVLEIVPDKALSSMGYYVSGYEPQLDEKIVKSILVDTQCQVVPSNAKASDTGYERRLKLVEDLFKPIAGMSEEDNSTLQEDIVRVPEEMDIYSEQIYYSESVEDWNVVIAPENEYFYDLRQGEYIEVGDESGDYVREADGTYTYNPGKGSWEWNESNTVNSFHIVQFKELYYKTEVTSNDWIAKQILEVGGVLSATEYMEGSVEHNIEVITVTPKELEERFNDTSESPLELDDVDLLYLSNSSCLDLTNVELDCNEYDLSPVYVATEEKTNDISWETVCNIFEYAVNLNLPVIVDDSIVPSVGTARSYLAGNNNIFRLAYMLENYMVEYPIKVDEGITYRYTLDMYGVPRELPIDEEKRAEGDAEIGNKLVLTVDDYESYIDMLEKLAKDDEEVVKEAIVLGSIYIDASGENIVRSTFFNDYEQWRINTNVEGSKVYGIQTIVDDIYTENFYYSTQGGEVTNEYVESGDTYAVQVSDATIVKYILNFNNRRIEIYKDKITVLDIEPTKYSTLTKKKVKKWIEGIASEKIQEIEIVQTTTTEFIGKIDDLNKEYDLIYFGSCIGESGLDGSMKVHTVNNITEVNYNDSELDGMIYTHVGDKMTIDYRAGGLLADEYSNGKINTTNLETRYAGNDITETKVKQLMEFVSAGYPVVISSEFFDEYDKINTARVDKNSYMYQFMNTCANNRVQYPNVLKETESLASLLSDYINMPKLNLSLISKPDEYAIPEETGLANVNYLKKLGNRNVLIYSFEFSNTVEDDPSTVYQVQLYVDINADGQFDDSEELDSLDVMKTSSSETVLYDALKPNIRYTASRELPDDYVGIIPWQLKISKVERVRNEEGKLVKVKSSVRTTTEGYTAVKAEKTTVVKVLQIASLQMAYSPNNDNNYYYKGLILPNANLLDDDNSKNNKVNRWTDLYYKDSEKTQLVKYSERNEKPEYSQIEWVQTGQVNTWDNPDSRFMQRGQVKIPTDNPFTTYFNDLKLHMKFDIQVDVISVNDYVKRATAAQSAAAFYESFYADYDMIIMGFEDCYQDIASVGAVEAIDMFIKSGRSVLFSHDTTSYFNVERTSYGETHTTYKGNPWYHWGYYLNQYIRSDVGMDRYGVTESTLSILKGKIDPATKRVENLDINEWGSYINDATSLNKEIPYYSESETEAAKETIAHEVHGFTDGFIDEYKKGSLNPYNGNNKDNKSQHITQVNKGQITTYPYNINIKANGNLREKNASGYYQMKLPEYASMPVSETHAQYYQLDMNIDKDNDGSADMVVWYCLSDNRNGYFPNDVRNNYYIYSVGNVTYTGMGHYQYGGPSTGDMPGDEVKLFVNTIIASLNSGKKDPGINIISSGTNKNSSLNYVYRIYDQGEIVNDNSSVDLFFYASDVNIVNGRKIVLLEYYYEVYDEKEADVTITSKDSTTSKEIKTYLKKIPTDEVCGFAQDTTVLDEISNEVIGGVSLDGGWVNTMMTKYDDDDDEGTVFKVYISAQTKLISSQNANEYTLTGTSYDYVTFKQRNLFDLD